MELIDIYDHFGQKTGEIVAKYEAHRKGLIHKSVCIWIINSHNEILLQKRAAHVMFSNMLDISFSGHIKSGETPLDAVLREGKEELGIEIDQTNLHYLFSCREYGWFEEYYENEIDDVFIYRADIPIGEYRFCDAEVQSVIYVPIEQLRIMAETKKADLMPYKSHYQFLLTVLDNGLF